MQTHLPEAFVDTETGQDADAILRACVHCGFCNATCPTYQLAGDELDGPRGRIYLIKRMLEEGRAGPGTRLHLDRCLTCRACETTCPSGVDYGRLLEIGREAVDKQAPRTWPARTTRWLLKRLLPYPGRVAAMVRLARLLRPLLPGLVKEKLPPPTARGSWPAPRHQRTMLILDGCVQPVAAPGINAAAARVLDRLGISTLRAEGAGCCGAISHHLAATEEARDFMRRNIDAWWPYLDNGAEAVVSTASACGLSVKDYGRMLADDPDYASRASHVSARVKDIGEVLAETNLPAVAAYRTRIALHAPCTLQHGLRLAGDITTLLRRIGFTLTEVHDAHLCCGAAGTYTLLHPRIARSLRDSKLQSLLEEQPECIATANIGCLMHLQGASTVPVKHWVELVDEVLARESEQPQGARGSLARRPKAAL